MKLNIKVSICTKCVSETVCLQTDCLWNTGITGDMVNVSSTTTNKVQSYHRPIYFSCSQQKELQTIPAKQLKENQPAK